MSFCVYKPLALVYGERGTLDASVFVNGSDIGVRYPTNMTWERDLPLGYGNNEVYVQAHLGEAHSLYAYAMIRRKLVGDVNDDQLVDDVDLSLFTRHWNTFDARSDFNCDGAIDDIDLSLLASHWNKRF